MGTFILIVTIGMFVLLGSVALWLQKKPSDEKIQKNADEAIKELHEAERAAEHDS